MPGRQSQRETRLKGRNAGAGGKSSSGYIWRSIWEELGSMTRDIQREFREFVVWYEGNPILQISRSWFKDGDCATLPKPFLVVAGLWFCLNVSLSCDRLGGSVAFYELH